MTDLYGFQPAERSNVAGTSFLFLLCVLCASVVDFNQALK